MSISNEITPKGYKKLRVWQKADDLAYKIYMETSNFPKNEVYGVTSQLRRSALSVPTNIVEGMGRQGKNELRKFIGIALGSLAETEYLLEFSKRLNYLNKKSYENIEGLRRETGSLLWKFYNAL